MSASIISLNDYREEDVPGINKLEELCCDDTFSKELIDLMNQNFVQEVESAHNCAGASNANLSGIFEDRTDNWDQGIGGYKSVDR